MAEAWIYVDESQGPHPAGQGGAPFWVASLITDSPIRDDLVHEALAKLQADPDALGNKQDAATLERRYFHGCQDSKNGHSWFCRAIATSGIHANFLATQWFFDHDEEGIEGGRLHRLNVALSVIPAFQDDLDCLHFVIARRAGSFDERDLNKWVTFVREAHLHSAHEMPHLPARFPAVDARLGNTSEAGLQVVDFLLWAVQRANLEHLTPRGNPDWLTRVGLQVWGQARAEGAPPGQVMGKLGHGFERSVPMAPGRITPRQLASLDDADRWELVREMAADVHRAAAVIKDNARIRHLAPEVSRAAALCELASALERGEPLAHALAQTMTAFVLLCDTWPVFDRSSLAAWSRAAEKRAVASDYLAKAGRLWVPVQFDLGAAAGPEQAGVGVAASASPLPSQNT